MHKGHGRVFIALALGVFVLAAGLTPWLSDPAGQRGGESSHQQFIDGFEGESLDFTSWHTCYWWGCTIASNKELQWYEPSQVKVADGVLNLTAEAAPVESPDGERYQYRSGMISSGPSKRGGKPSFAFTYGTVEARLRVPAGKGLWSALWMLPAFSDNRPEVDIAEILGNNTRKSYHFLHSRKTFKHTEEGADLSDGWHIYRLEWLPGTLRWYLDGKLIFTVEGDEVPDEPMYVMANLAVGGQWPGSPNSSTRFPAALSIDYIEIKPSVR